MKSHTYGLTIMALATLAAAARAQSASPEEYILKIDSRWELSNERKSEVRRFFPQELLEYTRAGVKQHYDEGAVYVLPARDSLGLELDTLSEHPAVLLALYRNEGISVLKVLVRADTGELVERWSSGQMAGIGGLALDDLNGDGRAEILMDLMGPSRGYGGLFLFSWQSGKIRILNPSGKTEGRSDFNGLVSLEKTDSGTVISAFHPTEGVKRVYILRKGSDKIELVSEKAKDKK
jgi:hypothetical protein